MKPDEDLGQAGQPSGDLAGVKRVVQFGLAGHVIFADISPDLLDHCRAAAAAERRLDRCRPSAVHSGTRSCSLRARTAAGPG